MEPVRIVLDVVLALLLLTTGGGKLAGAASSHVIRESLHITAGRWKMIGALELIGVLGFVVGVWLPAAGAAAAIGVVALMVGAVIARLRAGEGRSNGVVADVVILLGSAATGLLNLLAV